MYYGTTSGEYMQRRSVDGSENSITLRNLPKNSTYFIAVRAVSTSGTESAFSQEVQVKVGESRVQGTVIGRSTIGSSGGSTSGNPLRDTAGMQSHTVPGETGLSSSIALFLILSAVMGTLLSYRRQIQLQPYYKR